VSINFEIRNVAQSTWCEAEWYTNHLWCQGNDPIDFTFSAVFEVLTAALLKIQVFWDVSLGE